MKLNTRVRYGLRAMIQIALENDGGILQKSISEKQKISNKYLDHIITDLRSEGLIIKSIKKNQGYILAKPAETISVYDIYKAFLPEISVAPCVNQSVICDCELKDQCLALGFWSGLNVQILNYLESHTLADLIQSNIKSENLISL